MVASNSQMIASVTSSATSTCMPTEAFIFTNLSLGNFEGNRANSASTSAASRQGSPITSPTVGESCC